ncbi:MAG: Fe-S protein assembly co-chaperone HscB [Chitinophagaceae bacterium]|nr:Fe-S protein assembly co-chaperone HscB [Chitinophagaceae bacterium]
MVYFELFDLPVALETDKKLLQQRYIKLQKQYHPDYSGQAAATEQAESLEMSALINKAYKTLQSADLTLQYLLSAKALIEEGEQYALPPGFLMEVMELNELKMEDASPAEIKEKAENLLSTIKQEATDAISSLKSGTIDDSGWQALKAFYYKKKYIDRLLAD